MIVLMLVVAKVLSLPVTTTNSSVTRLATHPTTLLDVLGEGLILGTHVPVLLFALLFLGLRL